MLMYLVVGLGGALGSISRAALINILPTTIFIHVPLQILVVNVIGCGLMGFATESMLIYNVYSYTFRAFLVTGFLGGFTTFSSFILDYANLTNKNLIGIAVLYDIVSVIAGITMFFIGVKLAKLAFNIGV